MYSNEVLIVAGYGMVVRLGLINYLIPVVETEGGAHLVCLLLLSFGAGPIPFLCAARTQPARVNFPSVSVTLGRTRACCTSLVGAEGASDHPKAGSFGHATMRTDAVPGPQAALRARAAACARAGVGRGAGAELGLPSEHTSPSDAALLRDQALITHELSCRGQVVIVTLSESGDALQRALGEAGLFWLFGALPFTRRLLRSPFALLASPFSLPPLPPCRPRGPLLYHSMLRLPVSVSICCLILSRLLRQVPPLSPPLPDARMF